MKISESRPAEVSRPHEAIASGATLTAPVIHGERIRGERFHPPEIKEGLSETVTPFRLGPGNRDLTWRNLPIREQVLLSGLLRHYLSNTFPGDSGSVATEYKSVGNRRFYELKAPTDEQITELLSSFRRNPHDAFRVMRQNLIAIAKHSELPEAQRLERMKGYFNASAFLTLRIDNAAVQTLFNEAEVRPGSPPCYLANGFVDLGTNSSLNSEERNREKITADKGAFLAATRPLLLTLIWELSKTNGVDEKGLFFNVASWLSTNVSFGHAENDGFTKPIDRVLDDGIGVCRDYAFAAQLLSQQLGLDSRLIKADFNHLVEQGGVFSNATLPGRHAANLIKANGEVMLLDVTHSTPERICAYRIDPSLAPKTLNSLNATSYRFEVRKDHHAAYAIKNDGFWTVRRLARLETPSRSTEE